jgi:hypothetical protein
VQDYLHGVARVSIRKWRLVAIVAAVAALLFVLGGWLGSRTPWGVKGVHTVQGTAMRANSEDDLVHFTADDGSEMAFHTDGLNWGSDEARGEGNPPCLRRALEKVAVEIGYVWTPGPAGGSNQVVAWVYCQ